MSNQMVKLWKIAILQVWYGKYITEIRHAWPDFLLLLFLRGSCFLVLLFVSSRSSSLCWSLFEEIIQFTFYIRQGVSPVIESTELVGQISRLHFCIKRREKVVRNITKPRVPETSNTEILKKSFYVWCFKWSLVDLCVDLCIKSF